jgi:hypothetical protein
MFRKFIVLILLTLSSLYVQADISVPDGFKLQKLEATDGSIAIPVDWYYREDSTQSGVLWTISKEDPKDGPYSIGQRIQLLVGVEDGTKKPRKEFVDNFISSKRKISKIVKDCKTTDLGDFYRTCLEIIEPPSKDGVKKEFHILYSVFWAKEMDLVVVVTFGAPDKDWESVKDIADVMTEIEIIGPNLGK